MQEVEVTAYAKINLLLDVLGRREDGYHEVEMIMQTIGLHDKIYLKQASQYTLQTDSGQIPLDQSNLALKAAMLIGERCQTPPVAVRLEKNIPVAAGLAGGSTDAAAVLLGMDKLFDLHLSRGQLLDWAAEIGSDVPFCLSGPTALAYGRGEKLQPLVDCPKFYLVLVKPSFGVSTAEVYKHLDATQWKKRLGIEDYMDALKRQDVAGILHGLGNTLEKSTFDLYPAVATIKERMIALGGKYTLMSGSGPTVFSAFANKAEAEIFYQKCRDCFEQVYWTETMTSEQLEERMVWR